MTRQIATFMINGEPHEAIVAANELLVDVIRGKIGLTGTKRACGTGNCGACTVLLEGTPICSCLTLAITAQDKEIVTVEGLSDGDTLHPLQQAFIDLCGAQCGFCTAGMLMSSKALLDRTPAPSSEDVKAALSGNLCRCTGYVKIIDSVLAAAEAVRTGGADHG